jgi:hypothetical protein
MVQRLVWKLPSTADCVIAKQHDIDTLMPLCLAALYPSRDFDVVDLHHVIYEWLLRELSQLYQAGVLRSQVRYRITIILLLYSLYRNSPNQHIFSALVHSLNPPISV